MIFCFKHLVPPTVKTATSFIFNSKPFLSRMMSNSGPPAGTELESIPGSSGSSTPDTLRRPQGSGGHGVSSGTPSRQNGSSRLPKRMLMPQHQQVTTASGRMSNRLQNILEDIGWLNAIVQSSIKQQYY